MRRCNLCGRQIKDTEDCTRDFDGKVACTTCYKPPVTTLPPHGKS